MVDYRDPKTKTNMNFANSVVDIARRRVEVRSSPHAGREVYCTRTYVSTAILMLGGTRRRQI